MNTPKLEWTKGRNMIFGKLPEDISNSDFVYCIQENGKIYELYTCEPSDVIAEAYSFDDAKNIAECHNKLMSGRE